MRLQVRILGVDVIDALCPLCFNATNAKAFIDEETVGYTLHYFSDVDGLDVMTQYIATQVRMGRDTDLSLQWAHDRVVFPAIDAPPGSQEAVDAITAASRPISNAGDPYSDFVKLRNEITASMRMEGVGVSYYVSKENDYFAQMVTLNYARGFANDNLTLSGGVSYSWDNIEPLEDADTPGIPDYRRTLHWNFVATQVVSPTTVVRVGAEWNRVTGLQHDPYRNVYVAGANVPEAHPALRNRRDAFVRLSQYLTNRSSVKLHYRYYDDDWGVTSHTWGGWLSQRIGNDFVVRYRYRYYTQLPAFFYSTDYTNVGGISGYQTNDYRLGDYGAHLFGGQVTWFPDGLVRTAGFLRRAEFVFSYEHYFNSNNFSANVIETGLRVTF
jgi:hypothetical protein